MSEIACGYVSLSTGQQVFFRRAGEGPPLIILHPSPQSSAAMTAAISAFSEICTCIAIDTPGYGFSDPLPDGDVTLVEYADAIAQAIQTLGIEKYFIYGAATGSQIAIEMARRYPERVCFVMLDANGEISDDACKRLVESGYFADVTPRRDGGHLMTYWDMCRQLFFAFPWNSEDPVEQLGLDMPPPGFIHETLIRYLQAGQDYARAYTAALYAERRSYMDGMKTPATMTRWESSPVKGLADALIQQGLPDNFRLLHADAGIEARFAVQIEALTEHIAKHSLPHVTVLRIETLQSDIWPDDGKVKRVFLPSDGGMLHAYCFGNRQGTLLVMLHGAAQSGAQLMGKARDLAKTRPVLVIDLPGHGGSLDLSNDEDLSVETLAAPIISALRRTGFESIDLQGYGLGGAVAIAVSQHLQTGSVTIIDPVAFTPDEQKKATSKLPDLAPRDDGAHLMMAWSVVRNDAVYWPFWDHRASALREKPLHQSPTMLHEKVKDIIRLGASWREVMILEIGLDWNTILVDEKSVIEMSDTHPCTDRL